MSQAEGPAPKGPATAGPAAPDAEDDVSASVGADGDVAEGELLAQDVPADIDGALPEEPDAVDADVLEAVELARRFEAERDEHLDHLQRLKADFENYKRRVESQAAEVRDRAATDLVKELLPVLDACDAALQHGNEEIVPIRTQLLQTLEKQGLEPVSEAGVPFDPNIHEAVMHEPGDGESVVAEVLRTGYLWRKSVVRAAMVKVRG